MATIELYKDKINSMSNYIEQAKSAVSDFCTDLSALKKKVLGINSSVCDGIISKISTSSQTQEQQIAGLEATQKEVNDFIDLTINRDNAAADAVSKAKKEFYKEYDYLKPDSEKSDWEKFCDTLKDVGEWCKEHWKFIVTVVIVIAAVILLVSGVGTGLGAAILAGACWGAICGAVVGGVAGGIMSSLQGGSFFEGFENGAFDGAIGGAIGGAITGGLTAALGPATTMLQSVARGAGVGALSTGTSNMAVTAINYGVANGTLDGALSEIIMSGIVGLVTGGVIGGVTGGIQFKNIVKNIESYGLKVENSKVEGKIPIKEYLEYRKMSINNPNSDTMTLGKYEPTIRPDGTPDYSVPGPGAYTQKAGDTSYFSLGTEWDNITAKYKLDSAGKDMFKLFNQPALDDAVNANKTIRFSHDPTAYGECALKWEWDYLIQKHDFIDIIQMGDFWYGIK